MDHIIGRIITQYNEIYKVDLDNQEIRARVTGKLNYLYKSNADYPTIGDYVFLKNDKNQNDFAWIVGIQERKNVFTRKAAGTSGNRQNIAANIDYLFICMSMNQDFNLRRLERYLTASYGAGIIPVLILTKSDLCANCDDYIQQVQAIDKKLLTIICSVNTGQGMDKIKNLISKDTTLALVGSSGVGKSTLINYLIGSEQLKTGKIRVKDDKGHHTTTLRQLIRLPGGGTIIDTPGMRELALEESQLSEAFEEIEELSSQCQYRNCSHHTEKGCAVRDAIEHGELTEKRLKSYLKLKKEEIVRKKSGGAR